VLAEAPVRAGRKFYIVYDHEHLMTAEPKLAARIEATYRAPFGLIATSSVVADTLRRCGGHPLALIPCGLDTGKFGVDVAPDRRTNFTVGFAARPEGFKGTADAIEALEMLRGRYGETLRAMAFGSRRMALPDWIEWVEFPDPAELRAFYNRCAVFMVPSHFEGWGLPGIESMACGAALVTTDNGGCRDYAKDGINALVVSPRDPQALCDSVARLFDDSALRVQLAEAGAQTARRFNWNDSVDRLEAVLGAAQT
jgi:glycosyltransferase involved in cell wall biosynthesis